MSAPASPPVLSVCEGCITDDFLRAQVVSDGQVATCSYCGKVSPTIELTALAEMVREVIEENFALTPDAPSNPLEDMMAKEGEWERAGEPVLYVIADLTKVSTTIAEDIRSMLSDSVGHDARKEGAEDPFDSDAQYEESPPDDMDLKDSWSYIRRDLATRSRFFSRHLETTLSEIFTEIDGLATYDRRSVVQTLRPADPEQRLFRARIALSQEDVQRILSNPVDQLGPPAPRSARAGRMNAVGISVFYGAMEEETCIAEVRAPVGSYVVLGRFDVLRPLRMLDFDALTRVFVAGSFFDPAFRHRRARASFLRHLERDISRPVLPGEEELEYLPTQVIAEFLAERVEPKLDGVLFRSTQTGGVGRNAVLFNHAATIEPYQMPEGCSTTVTWLGSHDDDDEDAVSLISVVERVPKPGETSEPPNDGAIRVPFPVRLPLDGFVGSQVQRGLDGREAALRLDVHGIKVVRIKRVAYEQTALSVGRWRATDSGGAIF
jgi:hypothetical protein